MYEHYLTIYELIKYYLASILSLIFFIFKFFLVLLIIIILIFISQIVFLKVMKYCLKLLPNYAKYKLIDLNLLEIMN